MSRVEVISQFNRLYLGDSVLLQITLKTGDAQCQLQFNAGKVLAGEGDSIFQPEAKFEPAMLRLNGVKSVECEGGPYQLNATVVDFGAALSADGEHVQFCFDLTGGTDPDSFMVKVRILARDFEFGAVEP